MLFEAIKSMLIPFIFIIGVIALLVSLLIPYFSNEKENKTNEFKEQSNNFKKWFVPFLFGILMLIILKIMI